MGALPTHGRDAADVLADLESLKADDKDFRHGRVFGLVFHVDDDLERVLTAAHDAYLWHNALNPGAFPSLRKMTSDILDVAASLYHGGVGFLSSGGTESILMAVKAAKKRGEAERAIDHGNVVLPLSAHAAFDKAFDYFGVEPRRIDVRDDYRADVDAMADAVDDDTVLVVGSAPQYPQGVIDPIGDIAAIAVDRGINCHVDACMGGFVLPFLERSGIDVPPWDFRVRGVTSISADIHKYGYAPKGISVIMHRTKELRAYQTFAFDGWLGGFYGSPGILGTKPGGPIAAGWAAFQYLGEDGYTRLATTARRTCEQLVDGVRAIPHLTILGEPDATLAAISSSSLDVFAIHTELEQRGWYLDRQGPPDSMHTTCMPVHATVIDEFLADLCEAAALHARTDDRSTTYAALE